MFEGEKVLSSEKSTVKWGVMGTAGIASWGTIPGMQKAKGCELYAIAGRSLEKAQAYIMSSVSACSELPRSKR